MAIIINGRRINPSSISNGVHGSELIRIAQPGQGRTVIIENGGKVQRINPNQHYSQHELVDKHGRGAKMTSMPDRSKGYGFNGSRSRQSKQIITEQVYDLAEKLFKQGVDFDEDGANWLVVRNYQLPPNWHQIAKNTDLLVHFPD